MFAISLISVQCIYIYINPGMLLLPIAYFTYAGVK